MSEEDLQLLITLDDPVDLPEEDTFNHLVANNSTNGSMKGTDVEV